MLNERSDFFALGTLWSPRIYDCSSSKYFKGERIDTPELKSYVISIFLAAFLITTLFRLAAVAWRVQDTTTVLLPNTLRAWNWIWCFLLGKITGMAQQTCWILWIIQVVEIFGNRFKASSSDNHFLIFLRWSCQTTIDIRNSTTSSFCNFFKRSTLESIGSNPE